MIIVFDTETNGLPRNWKGAVNDTRNWPRVVQLAWAVYDDTGDLLHTQKMLIRPDGWTIPQATTDVHGITLEQAQAEGVPAPHAIDLFITDYEECHTMVAHNMAFDYPVLLCEFLRYGQRAVRRIENRVCTMQASTNFCALKGYGGQYKWPKLAELHQILFATGFDGAHDALNDVLACGRCYFELNRRGIIPNTLFPA